MQRGGGHKRTAPSARSRSAAPAPGRSQVRRFTADTSSGARTLPADRCGSSRRTTCATPPPSGKGSAASRPRPTSVSAIASMAFSAAPDTPPQRWGLEPPLAATPARRRRRRLVGAPSSSSPPPSALAADAAPSAGEVSSAAATALSAAAGEGSAAVGRPSAKPRSAEERRRSNAGWSTRRRCGAYAGEEHQRDIREGASEERRCERPALAAPKAKGHAHRPQGHSGASPCGRAACAALGQCSASCCCGCGRWNRFLRSGACDSGGSGPWCTAPFSPR